MSRWIRCFLGHCLSAVAHVFCSVLCHRTSDLLIGLPIDLAAHIHISLARQLLFYLRQGGKIRLCHTHKLLELHKWILPTGRGRQLARQARRSSADALQA